MENNMKKTITGVVIVVILAAAAILTFEFLKQKG